MHPLQLLNQCSPASINIHHINPVNHITTAYERPRDNHFSDPAQRHLLNVGGARQISIHSADRHHTHRHPHRSVLRRSTGRQRCRMALFGRRACLCIENGSPDGHRDCGDLPVDCGGRAVSQTYRAQCILPRGSDCRKADEAAVSDSHARCVAAVKINRTARKDIRP